MDEQNIYVKMDSQQTVLLCVRVCTNLAASVNVEQTHPTSQLLGVLNAVSQNTGGEIEGAFIRLQRQHTKTNLTSYQRAKCSRVYSYNGSVQTSPSFVNFFKSLLDFSYME